MWMKSEMSEPWTRTVDTASTGQLPVCLELAPRIDPTPPQQEPERSRGSYSRAKRLTERDCQIVELVGQSRALTVRQIQLGGEFPQHTDSRVQLRCQFLVQAGYLDTLPTCSVNEPAVYLLTRRSQAGLALLRERWGEQRLRAHLTRLGPIDHLLATNEVRVRVMRSCHELGYRLKFWLRSEDLVKVSGKELIPDGYFQIEREEEGWLTAASFFLELQRANRSPRVLRSKLLRYGQIYYSGRFEELFGTRALRVLFVFTSESGHPAEARVKSGCQEAERLGVTNTRFTSLETIKGLASDKMLTAPIWASPRHSELTALFSL
jgi:hypothetical protein